MTATATPRPTLPAGIQRGTKYRFVVRSAEEAIHTLRSRLGEEAKVLSVKQVGGKGLNRFLQSPRMEIVATVPATGEVETRATPPAPEPAPPAVVQPIAEPAAPAVGDPLESDLADTIREQMDAERTAPAPARTPYTTEARKPQPASRSTNVWDLLRRSHFSEALLTSLDYALADGSKLEALPLNLALAEIRQRLLKAYRTAPQQALGQRIAFLGTPGVGKTTALCKRLAHDVFIARRPVQVLKVDNETPNPDEALSIFCDVLGVPLLRDPADALELNDDTLLYLDLPGISMADTEEWARLEERLNGLEVTSRVLVLNGCYEMEQMHATLLRSRQLKLTHLCLTHMDEVASAARHWPLLLSSGLSPYFISHGQSVTSDYSDEVADYLSEKSFPVHANV